MTTTLPTHVYVCVVIVRVCLCVRGSHERLCSPPLVLFGADVVKRFCKNNDLDLIIRSFLTRYSPSFLGFQSPPCTNALRLFFLSPARFREATRHPTVVLTSVLLMGTSTSLMGT